MAKCEHKTVQSAYIGPKFVSYRCWTCKKLGVRSLGPSKDKELSVLREIDAAKIIATHIESGFARLTNVEDDGHHGDEDSPFAYTAGWHVGWLVRVATDDDGQGWPWAPTRPIAGQFDEQFETFGAGGAAGATKGYCYSHPGAIGNADGDCIECYRERTEGTLEQEGEIRRGLTAPDAGAAVDQLLEDSETARRDAKERQAALDAARDRPIGAPDRFDDDAFDVSDVLPGGAAK